MLTVAAAFSQSLLCSVYMSPVMTHKNNSFQLLYDPLRNREGLK